MKKILIIVLITITLMSCGNTVVEDAQDVIHVMDSIKPYKAVTMGDIFGNRWIRFMVFEDGSIEDYNFFYEDAVELSIHTNVRIKHFGEQLLDAYKTEVYN
jgi:hypothetical protein